MEHALQDFVETVNSLNHHFTKSTHKVYLAYNLLKCHVQNKQCRNAVGCHIAIAASLRQSI